MNFARRFDGGLDLVFNLNNLVGKTGVGVEVGVFRGDLTQHILGHWRGGTMFLIDVWREIGNEYQDVCNNDEQLQYMVDTANVIKGHEHRAHMIRTTSKVASTLFQDESLDFIYIDANHKYDAVKEDLELWYPKLKKGGVFSGHDYLNTDWYDDSLTSLTRMTPWGEVSVGWEKCDNGKDKRLYKTHEGVTYYNGVFGVVPAVDEFCKKYGYTLDVTTEIFGTWWLIK